MGAYCQDLGDGNIRCSNSPFGNSTWDGSVPPVDGSGFEVRLAAAHDARDSTVLSNTAHAVARDAALANLIPGFAAQPRPTFPASEGPSYEASLAGSVMSRLIPGALPGESHLDAVFRQAREEIAGPTGYMGTGTQPRTALVAVADAISRAVSPIDNRRFAPADAAMLDASQFGLRAPINARPIERPGTSEPPAVPQPFFEGQLDSGTIAKLIGLKTGEPESPSEPPDGGEDAAGTFPMFPPGVGHVYDVGNVGSYLVGDEGGVQDGTAPPWEQECTCRLVCNGPAWKRGLLQQIVNGNAWDDIAATGKSDCTISEHEYLAIALIVDGRSRGRGDWIVWIENPWGDRTPQGWPNVSDEDYPYSWEPCKPLGFPYIPDKNPGAGTVIKPFDYKFEGDALCPTVIPLIFRGCYPGTYRIIGQWAGKPCTVLTVNVVRDPTVPSWPPSVLKKKKPRLPPPELGKDEEYCSCTLECSGKPVPEREPWDPPMEWPEGSCEFLVDTTNPEKLLVIPETLPGNIILEGKTSTRHHWVLVSHPGFCFFSGIAGGVTPSIIGGQVSFGETPCPGTIGFSIAPSGAALAMLKSGAATELTETIIAFVDGARCGGFEVKIKSKCDLVRFAKKKRPSPAVHFFGPTITPTIADEKSWKDLKYPMEIVQGHDEDGWPFKILIEVNADFTLRDDWVPPDCCCVYIEDARIHLKLTVFIWPHPNASPSAYQEYANGICANVTKLFTSKPFQNAVSRRIVAIPPKCDQRSSGECVDLRREHTTELEAEWGPIIAGMLNSDWREDEPCAVFNVKASLRSPHTRESEERISSQYTTINVRDAIIYMRGQNVWYMILQSMIDHLLKWWKYGIAVPPLRLIGWAVAPWTEYARQFVDATVSPMSTYTVDFLDRYLPSKNELEPCAVLIWVHGYNLQSEDATKYFNDFMRAYGEAGGGCCKVYYVKWNGDPLGDTFSEDSGRVAELIDSPIIAMTDPGGHGHTVGEFLFTLAERAASLTASVLAEFIANLHRRCPRTKINLASHSLGARVLLDALKNPAMANVPIENVVLTQAAVEDTSLASGEEFGTSFENTQRLIVVYNEFDSTLSGAFEIVYNYVHGNAYEHIIGRSNIHALGLFGIKPGYEPRGSSGPQEIEQWDMKKEWWGKKGTYSVHSNVYNSALGTAFAKKLLKVIGVDIPGCDPITGAHPLDVPLDHQGAK